ncbi:Nucleoid occlusion protein [Caprobacter fermentans]|uniref:Nucleoid occlusion protein n=1 Tax=Caproicibacter fermentans TaxID=2576756 RepID=A0A6N8HXN1_9FIRM|nr:ParB N-terminal domain-containing protein [Caproicibacter fermentans]MVB10449.1 Nucleoid occlusion protein [Caproicibacter fermentans]
MFGRKSQKAKKQKIDELVEEEAPVVDPYDDEPGEWDQLSEADRAKAWYNLESLTAGSATPISIPTDQEAFSVYYDEAHRGNRCAEYVLGKMYLTGTLTQQNNFQAGLWFSQASDLGSPFACYELAKMMNLGIGFGKDPVSAENLYAKSYQSMMELEARSPNPSTEKKLAVICENALCPNADPSAASRWRQLALGTSPSVEMGAAGLTFDPDYICMAEMKGSEAFETQEAARTGRESTDKTHVRKSEEAPAIPELYSNGPASAFDEKEDATETAIGRESIPKSDVVKAETGRASNVMEIPVEYIYPAEDNPYAANDTDEAIHALALSIQINGLLNPLVLHKISDTEYRIISGEKRYTAITRYLHWNTIPATVKENLSANAAQMMLHAANLDVREYTPAQKLQFYLDAQKLLQKMKKSGEYSGPIQKGIADMLGMSEHQIRKYQKIVESLPKRQLNRFKRGEISLEKAYSLARAAPVKSKTGRASIPKPDAAEPETGRASIPEPDAAEPKTRRASIPEPDAAEPETGRASIPEPDAVELKTGRASIPESDAAEPKTGRAPIPEPDAVKPETGRAFVPESDAVEPETGHASKYKNPETYQECLALLARLPTAPGESCAVRSGDEIVIGTIDRVEVYQNALLISVLVDGIRRPYPVSLIGTELFLGPDCYRLAEKDQDASSF